LQKLKPEVDTHVKVWYQNVTGSSWSVHLLKFTFLSSMFCDEVMFFAEIHFICLFSVGCYFVFLVPLSEFWLNFKYHIKWAWSSGNLNNDSPVLKLSLYWAIEVWKWKRSKFRWLRKQLGPLCILSLICTL